jgi:branched-chain amino acid transport system substrate-binding protein
MAWEKMLPLFKDKGYDPVYKGLHQSGQEDYTADIAVWKQAGCELLLHVGAIPPDFVSMWQQCHQQQFQPKIVWGGAATFFPAVMESFASIAENIVTQAFWNPTYPFKDSLTGMSCQEIAAEFESATGQQWDQTISAYMQVEWMVDVFKRSTNVDDKTETIKALDSTKMTTIGGPIDMTEKVDPNGLHMTPTVYQFPSTGAQWVKSTKPNAKFELAVLTSPYTDLIKPSATLQPIAY